MPFIDESMLDDAQPSGGENYPPAELYISNREETPIAGGQFISPDMLDPVGATVIDSEKAPWWGKASSGYLDGISGLIDFAQNITPGGPMFGMNPAAKDAPSWSGLFDRGIDSITGVKDSTKIGEDGGIHTAASYLPQAIMGPEKIGANILQTLFTAGAAGAGRELGGDTGEMVGAVASLFGPMMGSKITKAGQALERKAVGASYGDYLKTADSLGRVDLPEGDIGTFAKQALTEIIESGKLGSSRSAEKIGTSVMREQNKLGQSIGKAIEVADTSGVKAVPTFSRAIDLLDSGAIPADELPRYEKRLRELIQGVVTQGKGGVRYLQNQKIAMGSKYDTADGVMNKFNRALYHDLQEAIETAVPEVAPLNRELSKWKVMDSIVKRGIAKEENSDIVSWLKALMRTTGGIGAGMVTGAAAGASTLGLGALAVGGGALTTPRGMDTLGKSMKALGERSPGLAREGAALSESSGSAVADLFGPSKAQYNNQKTDAKEAPRKTSAAIESLSEQSKDSRVTSPKITAKTPASQVEKAIDSDPFDSAVYEAESSRNPKAKNPTSTAKGGFQLIDETAKALGVKDPLDLGQNYQGFQKLKAEHSREFGDDPRMLYSAHFLGSTLLRKVVNDKPLKPEERILVAELKNKALPRFMKIYEKKTA